uniref:Uncharacterized protein n=1 Tax=Anguilla anguilla TaxID=7936 RepID=A0A0E9QQT8_ANGAN
MGFQLLGRQKNLPLPSLITGPPCA